MRFRLGEFECPECLHTESVTPPSARRLEVGRSRPAAEADETAGPAHAVGGKDYRHLTPAPAYDPSPTLGMEKRWLIALFVAKTVVNILAAASTPAAAPALAEQFGLSPFAYALVFELGWLALLAAALFTPLAALKWGCATCSCASALLAFLGLFFSAAVTLVMSASSLSGALQWMMGIANASVYLWLASVLYRDLHRAQVQ